MLPSLRSCVSTASAMGWPSTSLRLLRRETRIGASRLWYTTGAQSLLNADLSQQNLVEKIVQRFAVDLPEGHIVRSGDFVYIQPRHVMTHDNTAAVMSKFKAMNLKTIANNRQTVFTLDHDVQNRSEKNLAKYASIEKFAKEHGIDFYPAGRGIGHQVLVEEGYAFPQTLTVASDSHSNMYGGIGCLGTPVVRTDAASLWATGRTWWQVPPVARVILYNQLLPGVTGKDVIITLCGLFNKDDTLNYCIEFSGPGIDQFSIDDRLAIANMTTEWGALAGLFPVDQLTLDYLSKRAERLKRRGLAGVPSDAESIAGENPRLNERTLQELAADILTPDPQAFYHKVLSLDLSTVRPHVSGPNHVKVMRSVQEISQEKIKIQKAYLVSCVNSRESDIAQAAEAVRGKKVAEGVKFYIAPASSEVQAAAEESGQWQTLIDAGAIPLPAGCGPCVGLGTGLLEDGEVGISATNRNFIGRMGSPKAQAYLASPAVVAASAVHGYICGPSECTVCEPIGCVIVPPEPIRGAQSVKIVEGFPKAIEGELLFCHQDNLNTDGIYPGKYTYQDNLPPAEMARVAMENYDPAFGSIAKKGDILVGGFNFGTGSSREQAATALKYFGIQMIIAGSFSETYKRNAINNGFLCIEAPELVKDLIDLKGTSQPTQRTSLNAVVDFERSKIIVKGVKAGRQEYQFGAVGAAAQELIIAGGLEPWIVQRVKSMNSANKEQSQQALGS